MAIKKNHKYLIGLLFVCVLVLTACNPTPTPQPTIYSPGCDVPNLVNNLEAISNGSGPAIINLDPGCVYTLTQVNNTVDVQTITLHNGLPVISNQVTIYGNNAIIDIQGPAMGHFFIDQNGDLEIYDLTLSNGARQFGGAVLNSHGDFFASHTTFLNNVAYPDGGLVGLGGAVYTDSGRARIINNSHFEGNHAGETLTSGVNEGGAIYNYNGALIVSNSSFYQNYAAGNGGAIHSVKSPVSSSGDFITLNENDFIENHAFENGGALMLVDEDSTVFIVRSDFELNQADNSGGAIYAVRSNVEGTENDFRNNSAIYGGAVYTARDGSSPLSVFSSYLSSFSENIATEIGGGIYSENSDLLIDDVMMGFNQANSCGAISTGGDPSIDIAAGDIETVPHINSSTVITNSHFYGNDALQSHGGAVCHVMGDLSVENSIFDLNSAVSMGGGLLILDENTLSGLVLDSNSAERGGGIALGYPGSYTPNMTVGNPLNLTISTLISGTTFRNNQTSFRGGGIWSDNHGSTDISKSTFSGNTTKFGGGIYTGYGDVYVSNSTFSANFALRGGGMMNQDLVSPPDLDIIHTTFAENVATEQDDGGNDWNAEWGGGAINLGGKVSIENSLFVDNQSINCQLKNGMNFTSAGNYSTDNTCGGTVETNPMIGPLQVNGGGTATHALLSGSPLIDVLPGCAGLSDDQRGVTRPQGSGCDPGSYESDLIDPPAPPPSEPESSDCDSLAGRDISAVMLNVAPGSSDLTLYFKVEGGIPSALLPAIKDGKVVTASVGGTEANLCNLQGFEDRIYCMFTLPSAMLGTAQNLLLLHNDCEDPLTSIPGVSIPKPVCRETLGEEDCKLTGGEFIQGRTESTCKCP